MKSQILKLTNASCTLDFPVGECNIKDAEIGIYKSSSEYICIIADDRFEELRIKKMMPYICVDAESLKDPTDDHIGYGWIDSYGNWIDNLYNPVHDPEYTDEKVIGFIVC